MLTVVVAATSKRLTTVEHVRADLGLADLGREELIDRLIDQASQAIVDYCRRPFAIETVRETFADREFDPGGAMLARFPVVEILSVVADGAALLPAEYRLDETSGRLGRVDADGRAGFWWGEKVVVEYRAGYILPAETGPQDFTLPPAVERAAIRLVGAYLSAAARDPLVKSDSIEGVGSTTWWVPGAASVLADPEAEQLLAPYRRLF